MERYRRQIPHIGADGQSRLSSARILMVGAGGLGCPALQYLAGAGIGTLGLCDPDRVELSNLHRQPLFTTEDIGRNKAEAAKARLAALNPEITLHALPVALDAANARELAADYDLILDGTDNFAAKYAINDAATALGKPFLHAALQGDEGRLALFTPETACYRCLYPELPMAAIPNCAEQGIIGALAGVIGAAQALEAIRFLLGQSGLQGRLFVFDGLRMTSRTLNLPRRAGCPCGGGAAPVAYASPPCALGEVMEVLATEIGEARLIDVREQEEWEAGHLAGAEHLPLSALQQNPALYKADGRRVVLYCQRGLRSRRAAALLLHEGHVDIYSLRGGIEAAQERG